jgi:histidine phosphotransferase ChpT
MTDATALRVAGLLASRLCHDLVGPLGAVSNGLELIAEDEAMAEEALALAQRSAKRAAGRLQFFRYAFGSAGAEANFGLAEAKSVAVNLLNSAEMAIDWQSGGEADLPAGAGRILLNLTLLAVECLPRGGNVRVSASPRRVSVEATGPQARLAGEAKSAMTGAIAPAQLTARTVVGYYVVQLISGLGGKLELSEEGTGMVRLQATFPAARPA